jgi:hypothetical protein
VRFEVIQHFAAPLDDVAEAFTDPDFYVELATLPSLGDPKVLDRTLDDGIVRLRVRYHFTGHLSAAARAVLDPSRLTWVEESEHDTTTRRVTFRLLPDHYADRLQASGSYRCTADPSDPDATIRTSNGEVKVKAPLVARSVENAIISGLRSHLEEEVAVVERWLSSR